MSQTWTRTAQPAGRSQTWTRVAAALTALLVAGAPGAAYASTAPDRAAGTTAVNDATDAVSSWIVRAVPGQLAAVDAEVRRLGGVVTGQVRLVEADVALLPASAVAALRQDRRVASVTPDDVVALLGDDSDDDTEKSEKSEVDTATSLAELRAQVGAPGRRAGAGIGVALIDSGVARVKGLDRSRIVQGPDLSFESQSDELRHRDTFGHGTHLAGIAVGREGIAPGARLVSLKVANAHGAADVSQVLAAVDWVVEHRDDPTYGARVLNLSFGTDATQSYLADPLAFAVEQAWRKGVVVVTSAGNRGAGDGRMTNPATDPFVIAVGAADTRGTVDRADDVLAGFSSTGSTTRAPDLLAPGSRIASLRAPGSTIDRARPEARDGKAFRGSGTSQAAAVVSGAAAALLAERPELTPDQVKALLVGTATPMPGGAMLDLAAALRAPTPSSALARQAFAPSRGDGSLDAARGTMRLVAPDGSVLRGEQDVIGAPFDAAAHAAASADGTAWVDGTWNGAVWTGAAAGDTDWASSTWASSTWGSSTWGSSTWASSTWASSTWASSTWASSTWASSTWASSNWASSTWASSTWASSNWA
ncbi:MAG: S8 family serine peptidase [Mycobacteriales bacterium]|nr:S8 family serine peptidase [Mycobacteriales bacterium]